MFRSASHMGGAGARYRNIELSTKVDGASPHKLIAILFEELMRSIDATIVAMKQGDIGRQADRQGRALSILQALDASLDHEAGGDIAASLSQIYREARRLISLGAREKNPALVLDARAILSDIASAWDEMKH